ncbi:YdgH/BhsA/McbA-like domain containing protein, partial [Yersinia pestis]
MKLKYTIIASALLSLTAFSAAHAAKELAPEQAAAIKPFDRITITGRFNAINEAADAVSRRADKLGANSFYIQDINSSNNGGNWRVTADLYHNDA